MKKQKTKTASWGDGVESTDFQMWCSKLGNTVHGWGVDWLINVEGIAGPCQEACFWG